MHIFNYLFKERLVKIKYFQTFFPPWKYFITLYLFLRFFVPFYNIFKMGFNFFFFYVQNHHEYEDNIFLKLVFFFIDPISFFFTKGIDLKS